MTRKLTVIFFIAVIALIIAVYSGKNASLAESQYASKYEEGLYDRAGMVIAPRTYGEMEDEYERVLNEISSGVIDKNTVFTWYKIISEKMSFDSRTIDLMIRHSGDARIAKYNLEILRDGSWDVGIAAAAIFSAISDNKEALSPIINTFENRVPDKLHPTVMINQRGDNRWCHALNSLRYALGIYAGRNNQEARDYIAGVISGERNINKIVLSDSGKAVPLEQYRNFAETLIYSPDQWGMDMLKLSGSKFPQWENRMQMIDLYRKDNKGDDLKAYQVEVFSHGPLINKYGSIQGVRTRDDTKDTRVENEVYK